MKYTFVLLMMFVASSVFGSGYDCKQNAGFVTYSSHHSDGGPCCGRSITNLSYRGNLLKSVSHIRDFRDNDTIRDSNPNLTINEGQRRDLNQNSKEGEWVISHFSMSIELVTKNGSDPVPGMRSPAIVELICKNRKYNGRPIP